jgi:hypothetical protein
MVSTTARRVAGLHAAYCLLTGPSSLVSPRAFAAVTGPKREWWLVHTVGLLVTSLGAGLGLAAGRDRVTPELGVVAAGCAASLAAIDVVYVARGRIRPTYLADAAVEAALVAGWAAAAHGSRRGSDAPNRLQVEGVPPGG